MKRHFVLFILLLSSFLSFSQTGQWTWVSGDNAANQWGAYGTKGVPSATNKPGSRYAGVNWVDEYGTVYLFGGFVRPSTTSYYLNDLWAYDPYANEWTWISGDNAYNQYGNYGTKGVAAASNKPGARNGEATWKDSQGNFWMFGGNGYAAGNAGYLNDLWKFNTSTWEWTWVSGDNSANQLGSYGTKGVAATTNKPRGRFGASSWTDLNGNFWMFGGYGYNPATAAYEWLSDLWRFNPMTGVWTWVSGDNTGNKFGVYGTRGTSAAANKPGGRYFAAQWTDNNGNLYLFGGNGYAVNSTGNLNDLWRFSPSTGQWTWVNGDLYPNQASIYGTKELPAATNKPGGQYGGTSWKDQNGNLWLLSGYGIAASSAGYLNNLWKYHTTLNQWIWMGGDKAPNQPGVYGAKGTAAATSKPGSSVYASGAADAEGNFWLFGGMGYAASSSGYLNELWKYVPASSSIVMNTPVSGSFCQGASLGISFFADGAFQEGNVFTAQLSDASGSFAAPVSLGVVSGSTAGYYSINGLIPATQAAGTGYRVRIVSDNGAFSADNGSDIIIKSMPAAKISGSTTLCQGSALSFSATAVTGATYSWTGPNGWLATTQNVNIGNAGSAQTGTYTLTVASNGCSAVVSTTVAVNPKPAANAGSSQTICAGSKVVLGGTAVAGNTYNWTSNPSGLANTAASVTVSPSATTTYTLTETITATGCQSSKAVTITVNPLLTPSVTVEASASVFCPGTAMTFTATAVDAGSQPVYQWQKNGLDIAGATASVYSSASLVHGDLISCVVTGNNGCGRATTATSNSISINARTPVAPAAINGATVICPGQVQTYSATPVVGADAYTWTVPAGATIISGQGTTSIVVGFSSTYVTDYLRVAASNCRGTGTTRAIVVELESVPSTPAAISGEVRVCPGEVLTYSTASLSNATSYDWILPAGAAIVSGQGTTTVTVEFSRSFTGGTLAVAASNCRGSSPARTFSVAVKLVPSTPGTISGEVRLCPEETKTYSIAALANTLWYEWTAPTGATIVSGQGTTSVEVAYSSSFTSGTLSVAAINCSGSSPAKTLSVALKSKPSAPGKISGNLVPEYPAENFYSVASVSGATSYVWTLPSGATLVTGQGTTNISLVVSSSFKGGQVSVMAVNCPNYGSARTMSLSSTSSGEVSGKPTAATTEENAMVSLSVMATPNPTVNHFNVRISGGTAETVQLMVFDAAGHVVERRANVPVNSTVQLGSGYPAGIYLMEAVQGSSRKIVRVVKH